MHKVKHKASSSRSDHSFAAQELLQNGILVETKKGLICISLKDALNNGVGGVSLSEEDLKNVAAELLSSQDAENSLLVSGDDENVLEVSDAGGVNAGDSLLHVKPTRTVLQAKRTLLKKQPDVVAGDAVVDAAGPSTSQKSLLDNRPMFFDLDDLDSVLVSDSGLSSDTSEVVSVSNTSTDSASPKKRGGWPKGRKRKPENKLEIRQPKAPATGYVIFLNERRKDYKDLRFTEVTKLLGNEWSRMSVEEKKKYLDQAEIEKKRYREELKAYRQSEAYRQYLQRQRLNRIHGHGTEESDMDATDEIDEDEDGEELYCRVCDQYFHSLHNKKEHMYGKLHLASIAGRSKDEPSCTSLDESSLDGIRDDAKDTKDRRPIASSMDDAMIRFMAANQKQERELIFLRQKNEEARNKNRALADTLMTLNRNAEAAEKLRNAEMKTGNLYERRLLNLLRLPSLFN